jgi:hypothetical protein
VLCCNGFLLHAHMLACMLECMHARALAYAWMLTLCLPECMLMQETLATYRFLATEHMTTNHVLPWEHDY